MPDTRVRTLFRRTRILSPPADNLSDAALLTRFLDQHDEAAFESLVRRHGPLVLAACRSALRNHADADDAFQATFLVLVRRASVIRDRSALGGWLYRVAYRVSRKLRVAPGFVPLPDDPPARRDEPVELRRVLDEEIGRLPEQYRLVVELCYVVGRTTDEAAARLGWAKGTVLTRLAWARKRLRSRLTQRGVTLAVGSLAAALGRPALGVSSELVFTTVRAAVAVAAGDVIAGVVSARTVSLTEGVVRTMALNKLKWIAAAALLVVALTGVGIGRWTADTLNAEPADKKKKAAAKEPDEPTAAPGALIGAGVGRADAAPAQVAPADEPPVGKKSREFVVTGPAGTWIRELSMNGASMRFTMHFQEDRMLCIVEQAGSGMAVTFTVEADYSINKESTVYGVITSLDVELPQHGKNDDEFKQLLAIETIAVGQPFAFQFRQDAGSLTVKHFRGFGIGMAEKADGELSMLAAAISGRYTNANAQRQGPAPRPTTRPLPRVPNRAPAPALSSDPLVAPGSPASPLGEPVLPDRGPLPLVPRQSNLRYAPDPAVRMDQLINQSEGRGRSNFWDRFWINDAPTHLMPERIHGGIM